MSKGVFWNLQDKERGKSEHYFYDKYVPQPFLTTPTPSSTPCVLPNTICIDFNGTVNSGFTEYNGRYTLYKQNALFEYIAITGTDEYSYSVNCTGSTQYSLYTGYTDNGVEGGILFDNSTPDDPYHPFVLISGTPECGNEVIVKWELTYDTPPECNGVYYGNPSNTGWSVGCSPSPTPTPSYTPTPTPSATVPPVPVPLQYEVELSGGTDIVVLAPELYRSATFPYSSQTTDAVYSIDWGDGNDELLYFADSPSWSFKNHAYASGGTYTISVKCSNSIPWRALDMSATENKLHRITDWGNQFGQIASPIRIYFNGSDLESIPGDLDTTNMADIGLLLSFAQTPFTGDCTNFTGLGNNLLGTFLGTQFNQDISGWDVSNIKFFTSTFADSLFNQDISSWNITGATSLSTMFKGTPFNQDLNSWDTSNVTTMSNMFQQTPYNQPLTGWTTSNVTNMSAMFYSATSFNGDITNWDVSNVTTFKEMFELASSFNQDIGSWNVSGATNMFDMFSQATSFNQDLSSWDVSNVTDFDGMFNQATSFNQSLANWDIRSATVLNNMLSNCGMSTANYDATLIGWEGAAVVPTGLTLGATNLTYTLGGAAEAARTSLITTYGWTIVGDSGV